MFRYAQILNNKVHRIFEHEADLTELYGRYYSKEIQLVDITNEQLREGMLYDGISFSDPPEEPLPELKSQKVASFKSLAFGTLQQTDYKVIRHRDQVAAGTTTTLTDEGYLQLLADRQAIRDKSNTLESAVNACESADKLALINWE